MCKTCTIPILFIIVCLGITVSQNLRKNKYCSTVLSYGSARFFLRLPLVDLRTFDEVVWSATYPSETDV